MSHVGVISADGVEAAAEVNHTLVPKYHSPIQPRHAFGSMGDSPEPHDAGTPATLPFCFAQRVLPRYTGITFIPGIAF